MMRDGEQQNDNVRFLGYPKTLPVVIAGTISDAMSRAKVLSNPGCSFETVGAIYHVTGAA